MSAVIIINPVAGKGKAVKLWERLSKKVKSRIELFFSQYPGHIMKIAKEMLRKKIKRIILVGGDGSVNEAANALVNTQGEIGVIPAGSGNDFIKMFGMKLFDMESYITSPRVVKIDTGLVNEKRYFVNIFGAGFEANVAKKMRESKFKGTAAYIDSVLKTLKEFKPPKMYMNVDGRELEAEPVIASVGNGRYHGSIFKLTPFAEINDGFLDVCVVKSLSKPRFLFYVPKAVKGTHYWIKRYVCMLRGKRVRIKFDKPVYYQLDGEVSNNPQKEFFLRILPSSLRVVLPP